MFKIFLLFFVSIYSFATGYTELMRASITGDLNAVKKLVEIKKVNLDEKYILPDGKKNNSTALLFAIKHNNFEIARYLMQKGANVNLENSNGVTPLIMAVMKRNEDLAKFLFEYGANINAVTEPTKSTSGLSSLFLAISKLLDEDFILYLVENGADVNLKITLDGQSGWTPLLYAINKKVSPKVIRALVNKGADLTISTTNGWSPLTLAVAKRLPKEDVMFIANKGADFYAKTKNGLNALKIAKDKRYNEYIIPLTKIFKKQFDIK
jgi:ankyrin repeat protein